MSSPRPYYRRNDDYEDALSDSPTEVRLAVTDAFNDLERAAERDIEELSDEDRHGLMRDIIKIRPPSADTIVEEKSALQTVFILIRLYMASVTASNRNGFYAEPWGTMVDMATTGASFESGIILWYLFGSDPHDSLERVKAEGRGSAIKGLAVGLGKIILASIPSALIGLGVGSLIHYFEEEINNRPWLKIATLPPIARFITGPLALAPYLVTKHIINGMYPPNKKDFNRTPALHPLQRIALFGARAYDALVANELFYISVRHFRPDVVKFGLTHATVAGFDTLLFHLDAYAFATSPKRLDGSMYDVTAPPFLNGEHPIDDDPRLEEPRIFVISDDEDNELDERSAKHKEEAEVPLLEDEEELQHPEGLGDYSRAMENYSNGKNDIRCDSIKSALWYSARAGASVSAGVLVTAGTTIWGGLHPEEWDDSLRLLFYGFTVLTSVYAVERGMQNAHYVPQIGRKLSECCGSLFHRNNNNNQGQEQEYLLEEQSYGLGL